jgi:hypothetical protein
MAPASPALNDDQLMNVAASVIVSPPIGVRKSVRLPPVESISARMRISTRTAPMAGKVALT